MLEIPGEEAPTDPGLQAKQRQEQEEKVRRAAQAKKSRILGVVALLALLGVGAGAWKVWQSQQEAMTYEMDDYYALELEDIQAAPPDAPQPDATAVASATPKPPGVRKSSGGGNTVDVADRPPGEGPPLKSGSGTGGGADVMSAAVSTALPTGGTGLGGGAIRVEQLGSDVVLTDDAAIYDMAKRVINASSPQLQNCYNQRLKQVANLKGAWDVSFVIAKEGAAKNVRVTGVNGADAELESCMSRAVGGWRFQKIAKDQPVKKTYRFGASSW